MRNGTVQTTLRYLGVEVDKALAITQQEEIRLTGKAAALVGITAGDSGHAPDAIKIASYKAGHVTITASHAHRQDPYPSLQQELVANAVM